MKAIISTTYDDKYLFFLPIVTWCWNKLGVDVICFLPNWAGKEKSILNFQSRCIVVNQVMQRVRWKDYYFNCSEHKEATYSQCSRLYAATLDLPDDEILITSDIDMAVFSIPYNVGWNMAVTGIDLVPEGQLPICYITGPVKEWRRRFCINGRAYQEMLDSLLGAIECENMRGNYWGKDQEEARNKIIGGHEHAYLINRARPGTQFANNRCDRDDINWRSYCGPDLIDAHLWRPGYTDENFANILELLQIQYPSDNFDWLKQYREQYISLL